jgi:hypothetical protein
MNTADAIIRTLESPNVCDSNLENANVVDVINYLANSTRRIANAITPQNAEPGRDAVDTYVRSLTEAVCGVTGGLVRIANAIESLADAVREQSQQKEIDS